MSFLPLKTLHPTDYAYDKYAQSLKNMDRAWKSSDSLWELFHDLQPIDMVSTSPGSKLAARLATEAVEPLKQEALTLTCAAVFSEGVVAVLWRRYGRAVQEAVRSGQFRKRYLRAEQEAVQNPYITPRAVKRQRTS